MHRTRQTVGVLSYTYESYHQEWHRRRRIPSSQRYCLLLVQTICMTVSRAKCRYFSDAYHAIAPKRRSICIFISSCTQIQRVNRKLHSTEHECHVQFVLAREIVEKLFALCEIAHSWNSTVYCINDCWRKLDFSLERQIHGR